MIDSARLVADLKKQLKLLEADLRQRADDPETPWAEGLRLEYERAFARERTARTWSEWSAGELSQAAVAWIVSATFIRFCEDNDLLAGASIDGTPSPAPWLAGTGERLDRAVEHQTAYFRANPTQTARDWLVQPFRALAALPAGRGLLDPDHSPVWSITISAQAAESLLDFWRATEADGALVHDFTDPALSTRFLGDIYQDLSDYAKSTFALLQTPIFVEEFILDRTLTPAIAEFGLEGLKLIDPTCGSGHFLLGAFDRLVEAWAAKAPAMDARTRAQTALSSIHGVDLNPFAIAIARFRLTVAALLASGERSLVSAPVFAFKLAVGDSLLRWRADDVTLDLGDEEETFAYSTEDIREYAGILDTNQYHVVVGNPPYIKPPDDAVANLYRARYWTCSGQFKLSVPFMQLFFELALTGREGVPGGYVGKITSNSFAKRNFGAKLVSRFLSGFDTFQSPVDLTDLIDTSGAYIPGHGTPTVLVVGRRRAPQSATVRFVVSKKGEPRVPIDPSQGLVWAEIIQAEAARQFDGQFVSVEYRSRSEVAKHPWSLAGGGASDLMKQIEEGSDASVGDFALRIGYFGITSADDVFLVGEDMVGRLRTSENFRSLVAGEGIRDYRATSSGSVYFPYGKDHVLKALDPSTRIAEYLWRVRALLEQRKTFSGETYRSAGRPWHSWHQLPTDNAAHAWSIAFASVASHNHFFLDRGEFAFTQTSPVIKLPGDTDEDVFHDLFAVLNSSLACFWMKQVSYPKGGDPMGSDGARVSIDPWSDRYQFLGTRIGEFPLAGSPAVATGRALDRQAAALGALSPKAVLSSQGIQFLFDRLESARSQWTSALGALVHLQEELDWETYARYGLIAPEFVFSGAGVELAPGHRAFEVSMASRVDAGVESDAWFRRHGIAPQTRLPDVWTEEYRDLVQRRIRLIESDPMIGLLEQPEFKRRWATPSWDSQLREALTIFILDRLESGELWTEERGRPVIRSIAQLAEAVKSDSDLRSALVMLTGDSGVNVQTAITSLVAADAVPAAAQERYKPSGLTKFREWQRVWDLQRAEDRGERVTIPVPPKYAPADFAKTTYWKARGKLDVPKERFIAYPGARRGNDDTAVYGWAGWNHAEQALAASSLLVDMAGAGASNEQLMPIFAALIELEPWLVQWHSDVDPAYGVSPAVAVAGVVDNQLARAGITRDDVSAWRPTAATRGRRATASTASVAPTVEDTP